MTNRPFIFCGLAVLLSVALAACPDDRRRVQQSLLDNASVTTTDAPDTIDDAEPETVDTSIDGIDIGSSVGDADGGVAPDGATVVFTGTPIFEQGGDPLPDDSTRTRNDNELFRIRLDAQTPSWQAPAGVLCDGPLCQLSNDLSWQAQSPRIVPPAGAF